MKKTNVTAQYSALQALFWFLYCVLVCFSSVYLLDKGFTNRQIGLLLGGSCVLSVLIQPRAAVFADHTNRFTLRQITSFLFMLMALSALGLLLLPDIIVQAVFYMLLMIFLQNGMPFVSALGMDCINQGLSLNFGVARGIGSVACAAASSTCGVLAAHLGAEAVPAMSAAAAALLAIAVWVFRDAETSKEKKRSVLSPCNSTAGKGALAFLRRYPRLLGLLLGLCLLFTSHNLLMNYAYQIVQNLGGTSVESGIMVSIQCIVDIPVMLCFSLLHRKKPAWFWLRISGISFFLHAASMWAAPNFVVLYVVQIFEMMAFGLYSVASVHYVNETIDHKDRVQGQSYFAVTNTIGMVLASLSGGFLLDWAGANALLAFASLTAGLGMVMLFRMLRSPASTNHSSE